MKTLIIAAAGAVFLAPVVTELSMRLWPGQYLHLLVLVFVALLVNALLSLRLAGWLGAASPAPQSGRERQRQPQRQPQRQQGSARREGTPANGRPARAANRRPAQPPAASGPRESGTIKWFNRNKGFGFVIRENGEEIFVHQRAIRDVGEGDARRRPALKDGQRVSFVVAEREKGLQAEDVAPDDED